jgi:hypothetical protein
MNTAPKEIPLDAWAAAKFSPPPSIHTLRRWVRETKIFPIPRKYGREYLVAHDADYVATPRPRRACLVRPAAIPVSAALPLDQLRGLFRVDRCDRAPGIYFLWNGPKLLYVGQSVHVGTRVYQHSLRKQFTHATWMPSEIRLLRTLERLYLARYAPHLNVSWWN